MERPETKTESLPDSLSEPWRRCTAPGVSRLQPGSLKVTSRDRWESCAAAVQSGRGVVRAHRGGQKCHIESWSNP